MRDKALGQIRIQYTTSFQVATALLVGGWAIFTFQNDTLMSYAHLVLTASFILRLLIGG